MVGLRLGPYAWQFNNTHCDIVITIYTADSYEDGSLTLVRGVGRNSLPLVEMYSKGVWSPVCDHNWTMADATVACRELGYQGATPCIYQICVTHYTLTSEYDNIAMTTC